MIAAHAAALLAAALAAVACAAQPCGGDLVGTRHLVENARYAIAYTTAPDPIPVGQHFVVEFAVCTRGGARPPQSVRVDASMPEHKHGMNYRPGVTTIRPGAYRAEGLLFHMPGRWEITFDVVAGNTTERLTDILRLD
jgi:YtkA-like protein